MLWIDYYLEMAIEMTAELFDEQKQTIAYMLANRLLK